MASGGDYRDWPPWFFLAQNAALSLAVFFAALIVMAVRARMTTGRLICLIHTVEHFEDGNFDVPLRVGRGRLGSLEKAVTHLGEYLDSFQRFTDRNAASLAYARGRLAQRTLVSLSAESRTAAVAVIRIHNYDTIAPRVTPKELNRLVTDFLARVTPAVTKTGGAVHSIRTIGDFSLLAVWTLPESNPKREATAALRSAVLIRAAVKRINRDLRILAKRVGYHTSARYEVSIGIDSGEIITGPAGPRERKECVVIGDTVKNALDCARTGAETGARIVVTKRTAELGGGDFVMRELSETAYFALIRPVIGAEYDVT
jgi:class 3 adenylate cyclase